MKKLCLLLALLSILQNNFAMAEKLTSQDILNLSEDQRHWWYGGLFTGIGHAVSMSESTEISKCVWDWYFDEPDRRKKHMKKSFKAYPNHAPTTIAIALLKRDCNAFKN